MDDPNIYSTGQPLKTGTGQYVCGDYRQDASINGAMLSGGRVAEAMANVPNGSGRPVALIAHTVKGKGVSYMEDNPAWHGQAPNDEQAEQAYAEIRAALEALS